LSEEKRIKWSELTKEEFFLQLAKNGHCSALIKVPGDLSDLWTAHSSWFTYGAMNRIYKHYFFDLKASFVSAKKMSFSSYPGFLESLDDFYIMDNGLAMVQTTNSILNQTLYNYVNSSLFGLGNELDSPTLWLIMDKNGVLFFLNTTLELTITNTWLLITINSKSELKY